MTDRPLRLGLVGTGWPMRGGLAQYNALLASELSARGHRVDFVSFTRQYPSLLFPGRTQMDSSEDPVRFPATPLVDSIDPFSWFRAGSFLARERPDGVIFKYWMPFFAPAFGTIARRVKRRHPGTRVIALLDNLIPHERRPFDLALTKWFVGTVDGYIAQSKSVAEDLERVFPGARCKLVPHPVYHLFGAPIPKEEARRRLGLAPGEPLLLFFGFVRAYKGLDTLLEALPLVRRELPARLLVLGEFYEPRADTDRQIARLGLESAVDLRDSYVPNEEVGLWFAAADVVVLPYRSATQSGIVPIAWQLERPVICTDVGGLAEVVEHDRLGLVVPPEAPRELAQAILRYYREGLEARFVPEIRVEKRRYGWDRMAEAIETLVRTDES